MTSLETAIGLRCSFAADARGDPLPGTAAHADGFLLIERPGAWGQHALYESDLDPDVAATLAARAAAKSHRVLLIKRPGRTTRATRRRFALVSSIPGAETISWGTYASDSDLLTIPIETPLPQAERAPAFLVCTHGRHDPCCALRGRAVAARLARQRPDSVWECSHIGGDRFAPNVLVVPEGLYYGRVPPARADELITAHERSEVVLDLLRGRSTFRPAVQAAQHFARELTGSRAIAAFHPLGWRATGPGETTVELSTPDGTTTVTVRSSTGETAGLLTCKATHPLHPPRFILGGDVF